jgi:adenine-specific DNA-methyltransferase
MPRKRLTPVARKLRQERTEGEDLLWSRLRNRQLGNAKFRFQAPVASHVPDFSCVAARLIVELDGSQHAEQVEADTLRTRSLEQAGYTVLRFWNSDVTDNLDGVLTAILEALGNARNNPLP